jgi:23S rRNA pseudouridine955/2504/2580 synthase
MRVLRFLERRLSLPRPLLFRLLRSGKIRINLEKTGPERILRTGDEISVPSPFYAQADAGCSGEGTAAPDHGENFWPAGSFGPGLELVHMDDEVLVLNKAPGLPVQPGSKHEDCVSARLKKIYAGSSFTPAPAHRLDKQSSGLILAGRSYLAQRRLHDLFSSRKAELNRIYLVWVSGIWNLPETTLLRDYLRQKKDADGLERVHAEQTPAEGAVDALAEYRTLRVLDKSGRAGQKGATLLEARLLTGRKHQIRVQCASRGYPVIGDARYAGSPYAHLLLHACKIALPALNPDSGFPLPENGRGSAATFEARPLWAAPFTITDDLWSGVIRYSDSR